MSLRPLAERPRFDTAVTRLFGIDVPIVQGAMAWLSEAELVAAVSNEGGLGVLGASAMTREALEEEVVRAKSLTDRPFAVNFPLLLGDFREHLAMVLDHGVSIIFTSAGSPKKLMQQIKASGALSVHVVPNLRLGRSALSAGVDALVVESIEAGGHLSSEGQTALTNIPHLARSLDCPLIAAGGIVDGFQMAACMMLGADGVQMGTRFLATKESSAPEIYRRLLIEAAEGDTPLYSLKHHPGRALRTPVIERVLSLEREGASTEELRSVIGRGRAQLAAYEGDFDEGLFYAGAGAVLIQEIPSVKELFSRILREYEEAGARARRIASRSDVAGPSTQSHGR